MCDVCDRCVEGVWRVCGGCVMYVIGVWGVERCGLNDVVVWVKVGVVGLSEVIWKLISLGVMGVA